MTKKEFFVALKGAHLVWERKYGLVRCAKGLCPISALYITLHPPDHELDPDEIRDLNHRYGYLGAKLGLNNSDIGAIVGAADGYNNVEEMVRELEVSL